MSSSVLLVMRLPLVTVTGRILLRLGDGNVGSVKRRRGKVLPLVTGRALRGGQVTVMGWAQQLIILGNKIKEVISIFIQC